MATGVSSAGVRRLAGSGVQGPDDVGRIWPRWPGAWVLRWGWPDRRRAPRTPARWRTAWSAPPGQRAVGGLDRRPGGPSVRGCAAGPGGSWHGWTPLRRPH